TANSAVGLGGPFKTPASVGGPPVGVRPAATAGRRSARAVGVSTTQANQPQTANLERHAGPPERSAPPPAKRNRPCHALIVLNGPRCGRHRHDTLPSMRVLVTGGAGFIGSHYVRQ